MAKNIKDMVRSGMKPKHAVASFLADKYKEKKMSQGGVVGMDEDDGSSEEPGMPVYPMKDGEDGLSDIVMQEQALAKHLQEERYAANDNTVSYESNDAVSGSKMNRSGVEQPEHGEALGTKPDLDWINEDRTEQPMPKVPSGMGLSDEAKMAIEKKKKARRFVQATPM